jgi:hypothetical protein
MKMDIDLLSGDHLEEQEKLRKLVSEYRDSLRVAPEYDLKI